MKLSRRDRAAMQLALILVREDGHPWDVLYACDDSALADAHTEREMELNPPEGTYEYELMLCGDMRQLRRERRVLRARLALLLRVLLRADAGDFGAVCCDRCDAEVGWITTCIACHWQTGQHTGRYRRKYRPLWEQARRSE